MNQNSGNKIAIIGGGFCGIMTAVNLFAKSSNPLSITLFNARYPEGRGIAYKSYSDKHVLNVACQNMSAFADDADHFLNWCKVHPEYRAYGEELGSKFLPRNLYGKYLDDVLKEALQKKRADISFVTIQEEVVDIEKKDSIYEIISQTGKKITADKIVLATGNHLPAHPSLSDQSYTASPRYFANPWQEAAVSNTEPNETILIIGTGLTMVDVVLGLTVKNFRGKIIALSPSGFNILAHKKHHPQRDILDELEPPFDLNKLFRLFYKHVRNARLRGESGETVVDAVRSQTQVIWQQLSTADKKRFMTHLRHLWGVARHRLPGEIHKQIQEMIAENKLEVIAGRIAGITSSKDSLTISVKLKGTDKQEILQVQRVINCTGPQPDISKFDSKLYSNLLTKKMIRPDDMKLGIDASAEGRIIDGTGKESKDLFTLGSLLKGKLWESTAVPELRKQAAQVAELLLNKDLE